MAARFVLLVAALVTASMAAAQVPPLPEEAEAEAALRDGLAAAAQGRWDSAIGRFRVAQARTPHALEPLYNLGLAHDRAGQSLAAATWFRAYLAATNDPEEGERHVLCRRITGLGTAHDTRVASAIAVAAQVIRAAETAIAAAPPPEGGTRAAESARLEPARHDLALAVRLRGAPPADPPAAADPRQGLGITEAWLALAGHGDWGQMDTAVKAMADRGRKPMERALAAAAHARLAAMMGARYAALARSSDESGRGC